MATRLSGRNPCALGLLALLAAACADRGPADPAPAPEDVVVGDVDEDPSIDLSEPVLPGEVRAGVIADPGALLSGPKAEGRVGDVKLVNAHAAFVIEGVRRASGYRYWGGNVVDMSAIAPDGSTQPDLFGEYFFAWNLEILEPELVEVLSDGTDGVAHVRVTGRTGIFYFVEQAAAGILDADPPDLAVTFDYTLGPDDKAVQLEVTLSNHSEAYVDITLALSLASFGDGALPFAPWVGFGGGSVVGPVPYYGAAGHRVAYGVISETDDLSLLFGYGGVSLIDQNGFAIAPGKSWSNRFWFVPSDQGPEGLNAAHRALTGGAELAQPVTGHVDLPDTAKPDSSWAVVRADDHVQTVVPVDEDGSFQVALWPGDYVVYAYTHHHAPAAPVGLEVIPDTEAVVSLSIPTAARVEVTVTEEKSGDVIPARVTFYREGDTPSPYAPWDARPEAKTWSGNISAVGLATGPDEQVLMPAGTYRVVASHGLSHSLQELQVTLSATETTHLDFSLLHEVDTTGWVSGDFHIHALRSPDSHVPYDIRTRQAATEDLDVPVLTEHVYLSGLQDTAEQLGLDDRVIGVTGQEVTSFSYGHFNSFPLVLDPDRPNLGAIIPYDKNPIELFDAIRDQHPGDELIQVNHPRGAPMGAYFSYVKLDAVADTVGRPDDWSTEWDLIEVFNGSCSKGGGNGEALADWMGMTNHGYAKTLSSGSDTHAESSPPGTPRNWIPLDFETLRADHLSLVPLVRARKMVVSCGPFVEFDALDASGQVLATLGEMATVDAEGVASLRARVQAPSWIGVSEVRLLENGLIIASEDVSGETGSVRFDGTWDVSPAADAWYIVEVLGTAAWTPASYDGPPYAMTNPIEVDANGDGQWTPPGSL